jgi:HAD superfamily hydrolase (TIGR01484 family)
MTPRYRVLAVDYDGTLATDGRVSDDVVAALDRVQASGRKVLLVTGRTLPDLRSVFSHVEAFDLVVAENGAVLFRPASGEERLLAEPLPPAFLTKLQERGVAPLVVGRVIAATREPHDAEVLHVIREMGLELQVVFNKGSVMILPASVTKASGLFAALEQLGLSAHNTVGIGDAENDHAFLNACECAVAVGNALPSIKQRADIVTHATEGQGVVELVEQLLQDDLASIEPRSGRHHVVLGNEADTQKPVALRPFGTTLLVSGSSKAGKSSLVLGLIERIQQQGYQFCLIDPEGDYERLPATVGLGDTRRAPTVEEVVQSLRPGENVCVNLLAVPGQQRPAYFAHMARALQELYSNTSRPHWLVVDEAHHVLPPRAADPPALEFGAVVLVTLEPGRISPGAVERVTAVLAVGKQPRATLEKAADLLGEPAPRTAPSDLRIGEGMLWQRGEPRSHLIEIVPPTLKRQRHRRKYAEGELPPERSFYFRGPNGALNLRASNLHEFVALVRSVDEATWQYHLQAGDYSRWIEMSIKDKTLAREVAQLERSPRAQRDTMRRLIERRYAPPA